ncbi:MAG: S-layer y domain protein [Firmicutes bacterium]|nr:S-layer y domain protein [Bacillota bacterium]
MKKSAILVLILTFLLCSVGSVFAGPFADVPANHWAYGAVSKLAKAGVIDGYGDGTFNGDKTMTRYEMAQIVAKAMEHSDKADAANKELINKLSNEFSAELNSLGVRVTKIENRLDRISFDGQYRMQWRGLRDHYPANVQKNFGEGQLLLNFNYKIDDTANLFVRLAERQFWGEGAFSNVKNWNEGNLDHYGITKKIGTTTFSIGRQAVKLGQGGILCTGTDFGFNPYFEGAIVSTKVGTVAVNMIGGYTTTNGDVDEGGGILGFDPSYQGAGWYGLDASAKVGDRVTLGAAWAHENFKSGYDFVANAPNRQYYSVNTSINLGGGFMLNGEWMKSDVNNDNTAYSVTGIYHQNKDTFVLGHSSTGKNAIDQYTSITQGGWQWVLGVPQGLTGANWQGNYIVYIHDYSKTLQARILYEDIHSAGQENREWGAGFQFNF